MPIKYYFGYKKTSGKPWPMRWVEDDGKPVGGPVDCVDDNQHELTSRQFTYGTLFAMTKTYPYKEPKSSE